MLHHHERQIRQAVLLGKTILGDFRARTRDPGGKRRNHESAADEHAHVSPPPCPVVPEIAAHIMPPRKTKGNAGQWVRRVTTPPSTWSTGTSRRGAARRPHSSTPRDGSPTANWRTRARVSGRCWRGSACSGKTVSR